MALGCYCNHNIQVLCFGMQIEMLQ